MGVFEVARAVSSREGCEGGRRITSCGCGWNGWTATDLEGTLVTEQRGCTGLGWTRPDWRCVQLLECALSRLRSVWQCWWW